jgi:cell wall-associated NlpC family hydrolase
MKSQKSANIPFGIVTCTVDSTSSPLWVSEKNLDAALEGRPFIHGVFDCYSLVRAYYWQTRKIKLKDYPRDYEWWTAEEDKPIENLYIENMEEVGGRVLSKDEEMQEGDVILMDIQTGVASHAAIYLGNGLILHHLRGKISKKDNAHSWKKFYHTIVRYNGNN